jgi:hypothetical protein
VLSALQRHREKMHGIANCGCRERCVALLLGARHTVALRQFKRVSGKSTRRPETANGYLSESGSHHAGASVPESVRPRSLGEYSVRGIASGIQQTQGSVMTR